MGVAVVTEALANFAVEILLLLISGVAYAVRYVHKSMSEIQDQVDGVEEELELQSSGQTRLERHNTRMEELQKTQNRLMRYMVGDANDPSDAGLLHEIEEIHTKIDELSEDINSSDSLDTDTDSADD